MADRTEVYEDAAGGWRWRRLAANNKIVGDSGESYTREADALRAAKRVFDNPGGTFEHYTSTYCIHELHDSCRLTCKHCQSPCLCACHAPADG